MKGQDVPSVTVDPLSEFARATAGQVKPSADPILQTTPLTATLSQALPLIGKSVLLSALGAAPVPKALRIKKIGFKKSSL
jgi:hypothetical protein